MPDYYEVLGVSKEASENEIKKKYRELSMKHHPDRGGDTAKFQEINQAYETLSDQGKKEQYNMEQGGGGGGGHPFGHPFAHHFGGGHPFGGPGGVNPFAEMHPIFNMFGGGGGQGIRFFHNGVHVNMDGGGSDIFQQLNKPPPIIKNVSVTLEQAYHGATIPIEIEKWVIIQNMKVIEKETISVTIPKGIDHNEMIVIRDRGNMVQENMKGDIKLVVVLENHSEFIRSGMDLVYKKKITLKEALCGFSFQIKHLNENHLCLNNTTKRNIIKPNYRKIVPNLGFIKEGQSVGNLLIDFEIDFPDVLTEEQMDALAGIL